MISIKKSLLIGGMLTTLLNPLTAIAMQQENWEQRLNRWESSTWNTIKEYGSCPLVAQSLGLLATFGAARAMGCGDSSHAYNPIVWAGGLFVTPYIAHLLQGIQAAKQKSFPHIAWYAAPTLLNVLASTLVQGYSREENALCGAALSIGGLILSARTYQEIKADEAREALQAYIDDVITEKEQFSMSNETVKNYEESGILSYHISKDQTLKEDIGSIILEKLIDKDLLAIAPTGYKKYALVTPNNDEQKTIINKILSSFTDKNNKPLYNSLQDLSSNSLVNIVNILGEKKSKKRTQSLEATLPDEGVNYGV